MLFGAIGCCSSINPNFTSPAGIVLLLREMEKKYGRGFVIDFILKACYQPIFLLDLITDTTGKLRDVALNFFREREGK